MEEFHCDLQIAGGIIRRILHTAYAEMEETGKLSYVTQRDLEEMRKAVTAFSNQACQLVQPCLSVKLPRHWQGDGH
jgi:hypothetical protein